MPIVPDLLKNLPDSQRALIVLSGGLDSTTAMRLAVERYGATNVSALTFFYGQRQQAEIQCAMDSTLKLGVKHRILNIDFLAMIGKGFSANLDTEVAMPTIKEVLGVPQPITYVPNRNMILMSIAAAVAEVEKTEVVITGFESNDEYGYHDTTPQFVAAINSALIQNRTIGIQIISPFNNLSKREEILAVEEMDGNLDLLHYTLTCYNPQFGKPCKQCPSCAERKKAFMDAGKEDPA